MSSYVQYQDMRSTLPAEGSFKTLPGKEGLTPDKNVSIVVLDDDPTGTQTVHGVPVITEWTTEAIANEFAAATPLFFILTNSRSLKEVDAVKLASLIGLNIKEAGIKTGREYRVISRSDSTLRGHYPSEVDSLEATLYAKDVTQVLIPAFFEGGRYTLDGIHYVHEKDDLVPVAETPFAADAVFGFKNSRIADWVKEKSGEKKSSHSIVEISLRQIRTGGVEAVLEILLNLKSHSILIVDAFSYSDLEIVSRAFRLAEHQGKVFLYRTGASFVRSYAGMGVRGALNPIELKRASKYGGLIVVGSYVPRTTAQLRYLRNMVDFPAFELKLTPGLDPKDLRAQARQIIQEAESSLREGMDVIIYTSRSVVMQEQAESNLDFGNLVSQMLVDIVSEIHVKPRFLIAKGGITSSDIATKALGVKRAIVLGQLLPGVPVWNLGPESRFPGMPYFIFPGNVGGDGALYEAYRKLSGGETSWPS